MKNKEELIRKSVGASILISLGDYILLKIGNPLGPFLFAFGLLGVCYMGQNLFTGKCGFLFQDKIKILDLIIILVVNLLAGYLLGLLYSQLDVDVFENAVNKVQTWNMDWIFFVKSILCGVIMYIAVYMYKKGTPLGICFGIPLFILCGFQHCIANIITMGIARTFDLTIFVCILGNFLGSIIMWYISKDTSPKGKK